MKTKSIIFALLAAITFSMTSCEDMLSPSNERHAGLDQVASDTLYGYWGVLKSLQNLGERFVILGESRGDMVDMTEFTIDTIAAIADFRDPQDGDCRYLRASDFYAVINNCNAYLATADTVRPIYGANTGKDKYIMREYSQVWAIRAWTYLQLVQLYGEVPFYTDPLMSTSDVEKFYNGGNCQKADRYNLKSLLVNSAGGDVQLYGILTEDYPQYGNYDGMVHSMFCYFPPQLVMADICLAGAQGREDYLEAARYYFAFLNRYSAYLPYEQYYCNAVSVTGVGIHVNGVEYSYSNQRSIFSISGISPKSPTNTYETITVIPSTTNKQWGIIQRGVNDVFGFTSDVSVSTSATDTTTSATVVLSISPEPQLVASNGFRKLCQQYPTLKLRYEASNSSTSTSTTSSKLIGYDTIITDNYAASDARRAWSEERNYYDAGGTKHTTEYVMKQNPNKSYSTTYPVIYRKATVWLRLAECLNRAGFSEYAYAILADGLNNDLMPQVSRGDYHVYFHQLTDTITDYSQPGHDPVHIFASLTDATNAYDADPELYKAAPRSDIRTITPAMITSDYDEWKAFLAEGVYMTNQRHKDFNTGEYIPVDQSLLAESYPDVLGFTLPTFDTPTLTTVGHGIHARGSGMSFMPSCTGVLRPYPGATGPIFDKDSLMNEYYNFDLCVRQYWPNFKRMNKYGKGVTAADYQSYRDSLMLAVEELIIDEMGLELCFEGHRFNDLVRVATRRNNAGQKGSEWIANKVANRSGEFNSSLYSKLLNQRNWYFKLPNR